jgi:hypothetical protein
MSRIRSWIRIQNSEVRIRIRTRMSRSPQTLPTIALKWESWPKQLKNGRIKSGEEESKKTSLVASQSFGSSYSLSREMGDLSLGEDDLEVALKRRRDSEAGRSSDTSVVGVGWPRKVLLR